MMRPRQARRTLAAREARLDHQNLFPHGHRTSDACCTQWQITIGPSPVIHGSLRETNPALFLAVEIILRLRSREDIPAWLRATHHSPFELHCAQRKDFCDR